MRNAKKSPIHPIIAEYSNATNTTMDNAKAENINWRTPHKDADVDEDAPLIE